MAARRVDLILSSNPHDALTREEHLTMSTKIILNVDSGLSRQEMDDLRYLLADALGEFAARRTSVRGYVLGRYPDLRDAALEDKIKQVAGRVQLASKLHAATPAVTYEHTTPHSPTAKGVSHGAAR